MVYLCDFACWRPPPSHAAPIQRLPWGAEFDAGSSKEVLKKHPAVRKKKCRGFFFGRQKQSKESSFLSFFFFSLSNLFFFHSKTNLLLFPRPAPPPPTFHQLGDPTCLAHIRAVHEASGSLSAFGFPGFTELGPLPWRTAPDDSYEACLGEMRTSFGGALRLLFEQQPDLRPADIDILVTNSTLFAPTPSLSSMLVNEFGFRPSVTTLSVAGMGCSFGVLGVGALRDLMRGHERARRGQNVNCLMVTGECITAGFYLGKDPAMLASTGLIRQGVAAVWLSSKGSFALKKEGGGGGDKDEERRRRQKVTIRAKYKLQHFVKTHHGADDVSYRSMGMRGDSGQSQSQSGKEGEEEGGGGERRAMYFGGDVPRAASKAIDAVLRAVAPRLMSPRQLVQALLRLRREKRQRKEAEEDEERRKEKGLLPAVSRCRRGRGRRPKSSSSPGFSFASCCDHFALHPGVHSMLVAFMKGMRLPVHKALPSFASLRDYGNLSSASTWYVMANLEAAGPGVRRGERVLQLGVGTGVKAAACVWKALRDLKGVDHAAWRHLGGVAVEEKDLPLAVPDVLAQEAAARKKKVAAAAAAAAAAEGETGGENGGENGDDDGDDALEAAPALVAAGSHLVSAADEKAGTEEARARKQAVPEVRPAARERAAALARELDALHLERRRAQEVQKKKEQASGGGDGATAAAVTKEC